MNKQATLKKGCALPVTEWHFKDKPGRHVGPMVEDFAQAFAYDKNDTTISVSNIKGVIMLAIQALQELVERQEKRIAELEMMMEKR